MIDLGALSNIAQMRVKSGMLLDPTSSSGAESVTEHGLDTLTGEV